MMMKHRPDVAHGSFGVQAADVQAGEPGDQFFDAICRVAEKAAVVNEYPRDVLQRQKRLAIVRFPKRDAERQRKTVAGLQTESHFAGMAHNQDGCWVWDRWQEERQQKTQPGIFQNRNLVFQEVG